MTSMLTRTRRKLPESEREKQVHGALAALAVMSMAVDHGAMQLVFHGAVGAYHGVKAAAGTTRRAGGRARQLAVDHTTMRACPYCPGHRKVRQAEWPSHLAAHRTWAEAEGTRLRRRPVHEPVTPPPERPVNLNKRPTGQATTRTGPTPRPRPTPTDDPLPTGPTLPIVDDPPPTRRQRIWTWLTGPPGTPARNGGGAGRIWQTRPTNPGGNPVGTRPPAPGVAPVIPINPGGTVTTPTKTGGGRHRPVRSAPSPTGSSGGTGGGSTTAGGVGGGDGTGMAEEFMRWARTPPETLVHAKGDAQTISEALAAVGDALRHRMDSEVDRSIAAQCVEPYQDAMQHLQKAAEAGQEVYRRLTQRYGETAEFLARPDTPDPTYLKEGV